MTTQPSLARRLIVGALVSVPLALQLTLFLSLPIELALTALFIVAGLVFVAFTFVDTRKNKAAPLAPFPSQCYHNANFIEG